jgi:Outer membrane protein beta-barrel domain
MYNSEFEKQVQEKMEGLKMAPSDELWSRIEKELPVKPRRKKYVLLLLLLLAGSILVWVLSSVYNKQEGDITQSGKTQRADDNTNSKDASAPQQAEKNDSTSGLNNLPNAGPVQPVSNNDGKPAAPTNGTDKPLTVNIDDADGKNITKQINTKVTPDATRPVKPLAEGISNDVNANLADGKRPKRKSTGKIRTTISTEAGSVTNNESMPPLIEQALAPAAPFTAHTIRVQAAVLNTSLLPGKEITVLPAVVSTAAKSYTKASKSKWEYGINVSAGLSTQVTNPFYFGTSERNVFSQAGGGGPMPSALDSSSRGSSNARSSIAFEAGFYIRRPVNKRWTIQTGLSYAYFSYTSRVGQRVDSAARYYVNGVQMFADNYFRPVSFTNNMVGNAEQNYTNRVHLLQIPFEAQLSLGKKKQWALIGGLSAGYLLGSNALVYRYDLPAYFTTSQVFNKLMLSLHTGIGYTNRVGYPFSVGLRFSYGASTFVKKSINDQHLVSSQLFIGIPLKK